MYKYNSNRHANVDRGTLQGKGRLQPYAEKFGQLSNTENGRNNRKQSALKTYVKVALSRLNCCIYAIVFIYFGVCVC